ncbi:MAG: hypothetical protein ACW98Y_04160 [Candidatus Thorarchaeota archaeon]|jgi:hypothetical protein
MSGLSNTTKNIVERAQMDFLNETGRCEVIKDIPQILIGGQQFGPYSTTSQVDLPMWAIEKLTNHGYVELSPDEDIASLTRLQNISRDEEDSPHKLQTFHPLLYSAINRKMLNLQSDKSSLDPRLYDEIERLERMIPMLLESRLSKIIRVAKSGALQDKRKDMTLEERWLSQELADLISDWRKSLFS